MIMDYFADFFQHKGFLDNFFLMLDSVSSATITTHVNADPDALASALGLRGLIAQLRPSFSVTVVIPKMNSTAKNIYRYFNFDSSLSQVENVWPEKIDILIMVDTSDYVMTGAPYTLSEKGKINNVDKIVAIDHHIIGKYLEFSLNASHILADYSSATEIIIEFYRTLQLEPDINIAKFLLAGIITDTGHFKYANSRTLDNAKFLLDRNLKITEINDALYQQMARSEKIARLKAAMRITQLHYIKDLIVAISHVSSYEASACKALLELGADIALVVAFDRKRKEFRISGRTREYVIKNFNFHLGKFMRQFGSQWAGSGGGHDGAAGCYGLLLAIEPNPKFPHQKPNKHEFDNAFFHLVESKLLKLLQNFLE